MRVSRTCGFHWEISELFHPLVDPSFPPSVAGGLRSSHGSLLPRHMDVGGQGLVGACFETDTRVPVCLTGCLNEANQISSATSTQNSIRVQIQTPLTQNVSSENIRFFQQMVFYNSIIFVGKFFNKQIVGCGIAPCYIIVFIILQDSASLIAVRPGLMSAPRHRPHLFCAPSGGFEYTVDAATPRRLGFLFHRRVCR